MFTVVADVGAAFLMVAAGPEPIAAGCTIVLAGIALYWAGMVLNDVFDVDRDREERPGRPIPAGHISERNAAVAGWTLLAIGIVLAGLAGYLRSDDMGIHWLPLPIAIGLAALIVAYDGPLKRTPLAPMAMGGCRVLSFLLGASAATELQPNEPWLPNYVIAIAIGFGVYIMGITTMARREAKGGRSPNLLFGWIVLIAGVSAMAFAARLASQPTGFQVRLDIFTVLIYFVAAPAVFRGLRAIIDPQPINIQMAIRVGILTIIPLAACFAFLRAGATWGLAVFLLTVPSTFLSLRFRVT